ncbi:MAG: CBM9 family sugar-binding protein [Oscillospiraceae bacterium]|nr:CBM9 family sugar-binding protein [Oscillospiraceae bacterium]
MKKSRKNIFKRICCILIPALLLTSLFSCKSNTDTDSTQQSTINTSASDTSDTTTSVLNSTSDDANPTAAGLYDYTAPFADAAPVIDGKGDDAAWEKAEWKPIDQLWLGDKLPDPSVYSGRYKIVWTEDRLYYLVEIVDNYISTTRKDTPLVEPYNDDCLELFIDEDGTSGDYLNTYNAFAYHMSFGGTNVAALNSQGQVQLYNDHLHYVVGKDGDTYMWEVEMKVFDKTYDENSTNNVPVKLYDGKKMGFAVAYCDANETNSREYFIGSVFIPGDDKNVAYKDASVFAKLTLVK